MATNRLAEDHRQAAVGEHLEQGGLCFDHTAFLKGNISVNIFSLQNKTKYH